MTRMTKVQKRDLFAALHNLRHWSYVTGRYDLAGDTGYEVSKRSWNAAYKGIDEATGRLLKALKLSKEQFEQYEDERAKND